MNRCFLMLLAPALALALFSCGAEDPPRNATPESRPASRLGAIKGEGFDDGLKLPELTRYWTGAEDRNGNTLPVAGRVSDRHTLPVRLDKQGDFYLPGDGGNKKGSIFAVLTRMEKLRDEYWIETRQASSAALILFADERAPALTLLKLCKELVLMQVSNFWLVTRDGRDDALRLLPLMLDTPQAFAQWYGLDDSELERTARLEIQRGEEVGAMRHTLSHLGHPLSVTTSDGGNVLVEAFKDSRVERVQFQLSSDLSISHFARGVEMLSPLGFKDVELFWPALDRAESLEPLRQRRKLAEFDDSFGAGEGLVLPTLSEYWRASAADRGLPPAASVDPELPLLAVRVDADGNYATRARGDDGWTTHETDTGVLNAMRESAGEVDFSSLISDLQVMLAMDRQTSWIEFLGVREMMSSARCFRLYALTHDVIGPTVRLLDLSLSLKELPTGSDLATLVVKREGLVDDARYDVTLTLDGEELHTTGAGYTAALRSWVADSPARPKALLLTLPADEPYGTLYTILNSVAWLGMSEIRIGMTG